MTHSTMACSRMKMGLNQDELGRILGISHSLVSLIERGKYQPSPGLTSSIAEFFNRPIQELLEQAPREFPIDEQLYMGFKKCEQGLIWFREQIKRMNAKGETWLDDRKPEIETTLRAMRRELRRRDLKIRQSNESA